MTCPPCRRATTLPRPNWWPPSGTWRRINPDIVKEVSPDSFQLTDEQVTTSSFNSHYLTRNLSKLAFYSSASVQVINGGIKAVDSDITKLLAFSTSSSFRIQTFTRGQFGLAGVSTMGAGKVVVLGDCSIFTDADSNENGTSNLNELSNQQFALNIQVPKFLYKPQPNRLPQKSAFLSTDVAGV